MKKRGVFGTLVVVELSHPKQGQVIAMILFITYLLFQTGLGGILFFRGIEYNWDAGTIILLAVLCLSAFAMFLYIMKSVYAELKKDQVKARKYSYQHNI